MDIYDEYIEHIDGLRACIRPDVPQEPPPPLKIQQLWMRMTSFRHALELRTIPQQNISHVYMKFYHAVARHYSRGQS